MKNTISFLTHQNLSWPKSRCKGSWLHRFELVEEHPNWAKETCGICGKSVYFKICNGRINNLDYIKYHMRQVLTPQHNLYYHEYPNAKRL